VTVLIFHRIADDRANDWTTSTHMFCKAIAWLKAHFELISLQEAQHRLRAGTNFQPSICITFDDGYEINCRHALPLLINEKIPCTYFVSTGPVLERQPFEHDRLMGNRFEANTVEQLEMLADAGIEIGAHTRTHADLGQVTDHEHLVDELVTARDDLATAIGRPIRYFAFPYGRHENLSVDAFKLARQAGFAGVCSAYNGYNYPGDDPFHLQRCGVDAAYARLRNWSTIDPLRHRRVSRFRYDAIQPDKPACVGAST
jgi:peptidoglycan/xylan/chitin deacetylase (PgdA/CDA1 family)